MFNRVLVFVVYGLNLFLQWVIFDRVKSGDVGDHMFNSLLQQFKDRNIFLWFLCTTVWIRFKRANGLKFEVFSDHSMDMNNLAVAATNSFKEEVAYIKLLFFYIRYDKYSFA
jgi:hypothetical protein